MCWAMFAVSRELMSSGSSVLASVPPPITRVFGPGACANAMAGASAIPAMVNATRLFIMTSPGSRGLVNWRARDAPSRRAVRVRIRRGLAQSGVGRTVETPLCIVLQFYSLQGSRFALQCGMRQEWSRAASERDWMSKLTTAEDNRRCRRSETCKSLASAPDRGSQSATPQLWRPSRLRRSGAMGVSDEQSQMTAHALVYSELRFHPGQGQGVRRLRAYRDRIAAGVIEPARTLRNRRVKVRRWPWSTLITA